MSDYSHGSKIPIVTTYSHSQLYTPASQLPATSMAMPIAIHPASQIPDTSHAYAYSYRVAQPPGYYMLPWLCLWGLLPGNEQNTDWQTYWGELVEATQVSSYLGRAG